MEDNGRQKCEFAMRKGNQEIKKREKREKTREKRERRGTKREKERKGEKYVEDQSLSICI